MNFISALIIIDIRSQQVITYLVRMVFKTFPAVGFLNVRIRTISCNA
jgi:hypothetical protein